MTLGEARGGSLTDPMKLIIKLHVNRGHASAQQLKRVSAYSGGDNMYIRTYANEVAEQCEVFRSSAQTPHVPVAGPPTASMFSEKSKEDLLFSRKIIALRAADVFSEYSHLTPAISGNPLEVWDANCNSRIAVSGWPQGIQMDEGGKRGNEAWRALRSQSPLEGFAFAGKTECRGRTISRGWRASPGFLSVAMGLRADFTIVGSRMAVFLGNESWQTNSGALTPSFPAEGIRPTNWFLDPTGRNSTEEDLLFAQDASP